MATHTGSAGTVKVGSNAVAELKSWSLDQTQDTVETTKSVIMMTGSNSDYYANG